MPFAVDGPDLLLFLSLAFASSVLAGASGFGAGLLIAPFLLPIVDIKSVIPILGVAMMQATWHGPLSIEGTSCIPHSLRVSWQ